MAYQPLSVKIQGTIPQIMHNGILKDPLNPWSKELGKYSSKRKKTDEDHVLMRRAEFMGSLYLLDDDPTVAGDGKFPYWPADNIHAAIKTAAKMKKLGKHVDSGMVVTPPGGRLIYKGPKTRFELWEIPEFRFEKPTKRGVISCRPIFREWAVEFALHYDDGIFDRDDLVQLIVDCGKFIGLSEWPRRYGLFAIDGVADKEVAIDVTK